MLRQTVIILSLSLQLASVFAQSEFTIYRSYVKEDKNVEKMSFEQITNNKTGDYCNTFYTFNEYFNKTWYNKNNQIIAEVSNFDSLFYAYTNDKSAIVFSTREGKNIRDHQLIFNKKGNVILKMGYLYKTDQFATIQRNTYKDDTLLIGTSGFHITYLYGETDTSQTDSSFTTYDSKGRIIGNYKIRMDGKIDSMFITEYSYIDSTEIMWSYEKVGNKFDVYKRVVEIYDKDHRILTSLRYRYPDVYDGKTEYTYELSSDKKYKNTKSTKDYRIDGSIWKTRVFRSEKIEK